MAKKHNCLFKILFIFLCIITILFSSIISISASNNNARLLSDFELELYQYIEGFNFNFTFDSTDFDNEYDDYVVFRIYNALGDGYNNTIPNRRVVINSNFDGSYLNADSNSIKPEIKLSTDEYWDGYFDNYTEPKLIVFYRGGFTTNQLFEVNIYDSSGHYIGVITPGYDEFVFIPAIDGYTYTLSSTFYRYPSDPDDIDAVSFFFYHEIDLLDLSDYELQMNDVLFFGKNKQFDINLGSVSLYRGDEYESFTSTKSNPNHVGGSGGEYYHQFVFETDTTILEVYNIDLNQYYDKFSIIPPLIRFDELVYDPLIVDWIRYNVHEYVESEPDPDPEPDPIPPVNTVPTYYYFNMVNNTDYDMNVDLTGDMIYKNYDLLADSNVYVDNTVTPFINANDQYCFTIDVYLKYGTSIAMKTDGIILGSTHTFSTNSTKFTIDCMGYKNTTLEFSDFDVYGTNTYLCELTIVLGYDPIEPDSNYQAGYDRGYQIGFFEGNNAGWNDGFEAGSEVGYDLGYKDGYNIGMNEASPDKSILRMILNPIGALMEFQIAVIDGVSISIGSIFYTIIGIMLLIIFLKMFAGG